MSDYTAIPGTNPTLWSQNTYTANWLGQIGKANNAVLQNIKMSNKDHNLPIPVQPNITLARLCELGARDPDVAWPVFQAFWSELTTPGNPPVLFCLDSLSNIMQNSFYRAPDYSLIHSHDLAIVRHFVDLISGRTRLPNGGAVLAATSRSHAPISKSMELAIKQAQEKVARAEGWYGDLTLRDPFEKAYDSRADLVLHSIEVLGLKGLSKAEARGLMEYWARSGVLRSRVDEDTVAEKWALAGNGIVGEIQRGALWMRI
jgi:small subunit ribosomal protein S29